MKLFYFKMSSFITTQSVVTQTLIAGLLVFVFLQPAASQGRVAGDPVALLETPSNPVADHRAQVVDGHTRFTVLTPQLIRMEWAADGKFEDHASLVFINRHLPVPHFEHGVTAGRLTIRTSALELNYIPSAATDGRFTPESLSVKLMLNGQPVVWHPGIADSGNLLGTSRTLDDTRGNPSEVPMEQGLISIDGWTVVDDSTRPLFDSSDFRFTRGEHSQWPWVMLRPTGERQDWYFFGYGHDYRQALHDYVRVAGRIPIPPRFAFGAWWSRYWAYSDQELEQLVREFRENDTPLDVLVIDMDWHPVFGLKFGLDFGVLDQSGHPKGWSGYSWNRLLFPDPGAFLKRIHGEGLKVTLNMHPASGVEPWEDQYVAMAKATGIDPESKRYVEFDITDRKFAANYMDLLHHPLERQGIDFWWLDWQQEDHTKTPGVNPTWWLNYVHFTDQEREGKRPLLFHRWGGLGNHRYQIGFSGDTISVWDSLAFQLWFTATAANVGYAYWSHDIGGNSPGVVDPELYTRWVQFGVFSPILRAHTAKNPDAERRIWAFPEPYSAIMRDAFQLRYALQPYIYTEARRTYDTGVAFVRPLYYDSPEAKEAYQARGEYSFGDSLIVAPVTSSVDANSQFATQQVWLPPGEWIEWPTGQHLTGPSMTEGHFSIQQVPVYVKAGAIIPMQPPMRYSEEKPVDPLVITVFPMADGQKSTYTLYEDSSKSEEYRGGVYAWTKLAATRSGDDLEVTVEPVRGSYPGMPVRRGYELRLPGDWPPDSVTANGHPVRFVAETGHQGWRYEGNTLTTIVSVASQPVNETVHIRVHRAAGLEARRAVLDGFAGKMTRLRAAGDTLNGLWPLLWSPDSLIDAMQTGDRLTYRPQTAQTELRHFEAAYAEAVWSVRNLADQNNISVEELIKHLLSERWKAEVLGDRARLYKTYVQRALTQITPPQM
ncbi:MAG: TIM-barrel domain-containing protein [Terriglobales bacterium]